MSAQAIAPTGEQAAMARIAQLQQLIASAGRSALGGTQAPAETGFSSALEQAGSEVSPVAYASSVPSSEGSSGAQYESLIQSAAQRYGLDPALLHGLIQQESGFNPSAQSSAGASGLTQLMPATAASMGVANPLDPAESIEGGARYLSSLMTRFGGNTTDAVAAYNAGPGAVQQYGGVPPYAETQNYVTSVLGYAQSWRASHPETSAVIA